MTVPVRSYPAEGAWRWRRPDASGNAGRPNSARPVSASWSGGLMHQLVSRDTSQLLESHGPVGCGSMAADCRCSSPARAHAGFAQAMGMSRRCVHTRGRGCREHGGPSSCSNGGPGDGQFLVVSAHHRPNGLVMINTLILNFSGRAPTIIGTVVSTNLERTAQVVADAATITALPTGAASGVATRSQRLRPHDQRQGQVGAASTCK
jgi:hypothetical protein